MFFYLAHWKTKCELWYVHHTPSKTHQKHLQTSSSTSKTSHLPTVPTWVLPMIFSSPAMFSLPPKAAISQPPSTFHPTPSRRISCIGVVIFSLGLGRHAGSFRQVGFGGRANHQVLLRMMNHHDSNEQLRKNWFWVWKIDTHAVKPSNKGESSGNYLF